MQRNIQAEDIKFISLEKMFIWSKVNRVVNHSVNIGVVEIKVGNFLEKEQLFRKFRATCGQDYSQALRVQMPNAHQCSTKSPLQSFASTESLNI